MADVPEASRGHRFYFCALALLVIALWVSTKLVEAWRMGCYLLTFWAWDHLVNNLRRSQRNWQRHLVLIDSFVIMIIVLNLEVLHDVCVWRRHDLGQVWDEAAIRHSAEELGRMLNISVPAMMKDVDLGSTYLDRLLLIRIPICAPIFVCITGIFSSVFALTHLFIMWISDADQETWNENFNRRKMVIGINFLPFVYGLMALKGSLRSWQYITCSFLDTWSPEMLNTVSTWHGQRGMVRLLQIFSDTSLSIADAYEAWAVSLFGQLIMRVVKSSSDSVVKGPYKSQKLAHRLRKSLFKTADRGLLCFRFIAMATSVYTLVLSLIEFDTVFLRRDLSIIIGKTDVLDASNWPDISLFCSGMGNVATTLAIMDLIILEEDFKAELSSIAWVFHKFLSIKVLVSLVFVQQLVLLIFKRFMGWSEFQGVLASSGILCLECMLLSFYHTLAWGHREEYLNLTQLHRKRTDYESYKSELDDALRSLDERSEDAKRLGMELSALHETLTGLEIQFKGRSQPFVATDSIPENATHQDSSNASEASLSQPLLPRHS
eukprot:TRINITY_DN4769_c3_g1_i1.p1 TRINITY_DN4769_c3_g1~~TRINITY_DN4769_c3_g1_i1.p1  ORF type:complete len:547 (+),score=81.03 TRINITY_DN4769_c3_g1_i1:51-1691(+)